MTLPGNSCAETLTTGKPIRILCPAAGFHSKRRKNLRTYGGCDFGADPLVPAHTQQIFWTPQIDPAAILFAAGPRPDGFSITADELRLRAIFQHDPSHLRLDIRGEHYDVTLADPQDENPLAAMVMFDALTPDRQTALTRFWSAIKGKRVPNDPRMTPQRRERARQMLRAVDGRRAGATYRSIGEVLFPGHRIDAASWAGDALREITIRLARDGVKLVEGGYRSLLRRPRRS